MTRTGYEVHIYRRPDQGPLSPTMCFGPGRAWPRVRRHDYRERCTA